MDYYYYAEKIFESFLKGARIRGFDFKKDSFAILGRAAEESEDVLSWNDYIKLMRLRDFLMKSYVDVED